MAWRRSPGPQGLRVQDSRSESDFRPDFHRGKQWYAHHRVCEAQMRACNLKWFLVEGLHRAQSEDTVCEHDG